MINLQALLVWSEEQMKKNNAELLPKNAKMEKMTKIRAYLRAIIDRCKIIIIADEKKVKHQTEIEENVSELVKIGLVSPTEKPTTTTAPPLYGKSTPTANNS